MSQLEQLNLKSVKTSDLIQKLKAKFENVKRDNINNNTTTNNNVNSFINPNSKSLQMENQLLKEKIEELKKEIEVTAVEHKNHSFNSLNSKFFLKADSSKIFQ
jgi:hypothetical protein